MAAFKTHTIESAPEAGRKILEGVKNAYGFVPNLTATMVESPALAEAYVSIGKIFDKSSFNASEKQVVLLTVSRLNECEYCVAAHSTIAAMSKVPEKVVEALRTDKPIDDPKLEALRRFTHQVVETRGWPDTDEFDAFFAAGYVREQVLEVVLGVAMKTMSNYTNHIAGTRLDDAFAPARWTAPEARVA